MSETRIQIVNPTGVRVTKETKLAGRSYNSLCGRRIGLLDNNKPNADKFLELVAARLRQRYEAVEFVAQRKMTRTAAERIHELTAQCDVVINALAD